MLYYTKNSSKSIKTKAILEKLFFSCKTQKKLSFNTLKESKWHMDNFRKIIKEKNINFREYS
jgi:hypothetical protein